MTASPAHILVIDDEPQVRKVLRECLAAEGYAVSEAKDGAELQAYLDHQVVDLITLDLKLAGEDGLSLARQIRSQRNIPIVIITGKGKVIDRVAGLELGADDYIAKPFNVREVLARVRAVLRRYGSSEQIATARPLPDTTVRYEFNGWVLDRARRQLTTLDGQVQSLTTAEFNLLEVFVRNPQRVLSRDEIMDMLKGHDWSPYDRTIDSVVARLRKKIEPDADASQLIKTVHGVGYVFTGDVRRV